MLEVKLSDYEYKKVTEQNSLALLQSNVINNDHNHHHHQSPPPPYVIERFDVEQQTDDWLIPGNSNSSSSCSSSNNNIDDESTTNSVITVKCKNDDVNDDDEDGDDDDDETTADQSISSNDLSSVNGDVLLQHQSIPLEIISTVDSIDILKQCDHIEKIIENDIKLMTDPDIQREEELILFKEQCAKLGEENVQLKRQINDVLLKTNGISINSLLAIGVPMFAILIYLFISPYL